MTREPLLSRKPELAREAAQKFLDQQRAFHRIPPEYVVVSPRDFPYLDLAFYDDTQRWMEQRGFVMTGDIEDRKLSRQYPNTRTFVRCLGSPDGVLGVCIQHYPEQQGWRSLWDRFKYLLAGIPRQSSEYRLVSFGTQLSDASELATTVVAGADTPTHMPGILNYKLPEGTPLIELLGAHRMRLRQWLDEHPEGSVVPVKTLDEALAYSYEWHDRIMAHQQSIGYTTKEECIHSLGEQDGRALYNAIQAILQEEQGLMAA